MDSTSVQKLNKLTDRVEYCLKNFPETRNSDIDLFARLCESFYPPFLKPLYNWRDLAYAMHQVPSLDHIARVRRKVIEKYHYQRYLPTSPEVAANRQINRQKWEEYALQNNLDIAVHAVTPEDIEL